MYAVSNRKQQILQSVNDEQRLPVLDYTGPSIILAGAGAGKTKTIVARAAYMIEDGIDPYSILIFTFTRKAADELRERITNEIGEKGKCITTGTYHSFCCRLLRSFVEKLGVWTRWFSIYDTEDSEKVISKLLQKNKIDKSIKSGGILSKISHWKEKVMNPSAAEAAVEKNKFDTIAAQIYKQYAEEMVAQNALDFDDLIYVTIRLFERFPEVRQTVNKQYKYIIADEAQDSSPRDLELITYLAGERKNLCLVGDDFQSIYGFRGSDINAFFDFVDEHKLQKFYLNQNYRSTQTIVNAAQSVIDRNPKQFKKNLFSDNDKGTPIIMHAAGTPQKEAQYVTKIVKTLKKNGLVENYSDIAVLYRMNYLSRIVEESFLANNIPYNLLSGLPFYSRKEIKDIMAFLRLLVNPHDQIAFSRAIQNPNRGIGEKTLEKINTCIYEESCATITLTDIIESLKSKIEGTGKKGAADFAAILETINIQKEFESPKDLIRTLVNVSNYEKFLRKKSKNREDFEDRKKNINELIRLASNYDSLNAFVGDFTVTESYSEEEEKEKKDGVVMSSIHGSKGLEYRVVILIGCNETVIPSYMALQYDDVPEERRLFYVGLTRAKDMVFITRPEVNYGRQGIDFMKKSRFINEIKKEYIYEK